MKNKKAYTLICQLLMFATLVSVFSSCSSIYNFSIEIRQPAEVTFPTDVSRVVIVNNAAFPAEGDYGTECIVNGKEISMPFTIKFDSAVGTSVLALAKGIDSENFFSKVMVYKVPVRTDKNVLKIQQIPQSLTQTIYGVTEADAIISIDRCLFNYKQGVAQLASGYSLEPYYTFVKTKTKILVTYSALFKGKEDVFTSFMLQDSLFFDSQVSGDSLELYNEIPNAMIREAAEYIGEKAVAYFVPSWKKVDRCLYTSYNSRMKEALAYARADKWITAGNIWQELFNSKNSLKTQAFLAYNLAVACEMQDDLDKSLEWVQKAEMLFKQDNEKNNEKEIDRTTSYFSSLNERKINDLLLNKQFGIE